MSLWWGDVVVDDGESGPGGDQGSATMSNGSRISSEGCPKLGLIGSRGVVMSSLSVHAWSLTIAVTSCMIATVVVVVLSCLCCASFSRDALEPRGGLGGCSLTLRADFEPIFADFEI